MAPPAVGYIHGGTDAREVARLFKQAKWCAPWMLRHFDALPGMRVLDLASGVGAMAHELLLRFPDVQLFGVDLSRAQLRAAMDLRPRVPNVCANGLALPFASGTFDRVHFSWFLEHVPAPTAIAALQEVRRVLRSGGYAHFTEVDNSTFRTVPVLPAVEAAMQALNLGQQQAGGDPFIGPKLEAYARQAGFERVEARPMPIVGDARDPTYFAGFVDEFSEIFESVDEALGAPLEEAARTLRGLARREGASIHYCATVVQAFASERAAIAPAGK